MGFTLLPTPAARIVNLQLAGGSTNYNCTCGCEYRVSAEFRKKIWIVRFSLHTNNRLSLRFGVLLLGSEWNNEYQYGIWNIWWNTLLYKVYD